jgi:alpha-tubulin suppressor-like RCC1 family protein
MVLAAGVYAAPPTAATPADVPAGLGIRASITGGQAHTCALTSAGGVKCWGQNDLGQLGAGGAGGGSSLPFFDVAGLPPDVKSVDAGSDHTCAVTAAGAALCWGDGRRGQIGDGVPDIRPAAVGVTGLGSGVRAISAGKVHSCALMAGGAVKCWGANDRGQLGDGTTQDHPTPVDVTSLGSGVRTISAGDDYTCAISAARGVVCWGANQVGQLGDGTTVDRSTPAPVPGLSGASMIDTGIASPTFAGGTAPQTCAVSLAGTVACWGNNSSGQLGDGTTVSRPTPGAVVGLPAGVVAVATGTQHTCALTASGMVSCWGSGFVGQLGDGSPTSQATTPRGVAGLPAAAEVTAGGFHTCALDRRGGLRCWGANIVGQVGDGQSEQFRLTPIDVSGSFHRPECPALILPRHATITMTNGYALGSRAGFAADSGYRLTGPADLRCQPDATWNGSAPGAETTGTVTVTPDTGLVDAQVVTVTLAGWPAGGTVPWCQAVLFGQASPSNCGNLLVFSSTDATGTVVATYTVTRVMFVPALGRSVDCALEPICVMAATDIQDIAGSVRSTPLSFALP